MVTNMKDWVVDSRATSTSVGIEITSGKVLSLVTFFMCRYPLELGVNISTGKNRSENLV
ncbi:hypothetical protein AAG906_040256 [Vitis piasezkii]